MNSAFGIDHGEISKAWPGSRKQQMRDQNRAKQQAARARAAKVRGNLKKIPGKVTNAGNAIGNASVSINDVGRGAAKGFNAIGRGVNRHPGLTGAAVVGGGGYAAYRAMQSPELPKQKRQTR